MDEGGVDVIEVNEVASPPRPSPYAVTATMAATYTRPDPRDGADEIIEGDEKRYKRTAGSSSAIERGAKSLCVNRVS